MYFNWIIGYGYNDIGCEKIEEIYFKVFNIEDVFVRLIIVNGIYVFILCI